MSDKLIRPVRGLSILPLLWRASQAGLLSALINVSIWAVLNGDFDAVRVGPPDRQEPFWWGAPIMFSLFGALGAGVVYALVSRFARAPQRLFLWLALGVLVLSFAMPTSLENPPWSVFLALELMHVVVFVCVLLSVPRR